MNKQDIGRLQDQAIALSGLLNALNADHFLATLQGAREEYSDRGCGDDVKSQSFWWMQERYNSIAAGLTAAIAIAETIESMTDTLWTETGGGLH